MHVGDGHGLYTASVQSEKHWQFWIYAFLAHQFAWDAVPSPVHGCCNAAARDSRIWGCGDRGQADPLGLTAPHRHSSECWDHLNHHLGFFPTKGILEWFLLWNPYTDISQYLYLKDCKWFQKTGWQNSISSCCIVTYDNYCEIYFRWREITTTL